MVKRRILFVVQLGVALLPQCGSFSPQEYYKVARPDVSRAFLFLPFTEHVLTVCPEIANESPMEKMVSNGVLDAVIVIGEVEFGLVEPGNHVLAYLSVNDGFGVGGFKARLGTRRANAGELGRRSGLADI